ncbi:MAG: amidohydrolase [Candidatus Sungiibacteriota bacterium]
MTKQATIMYGIHTAMDTIFLNGKFYLGDRVWSPGLLVGSGGLITKVFSSAAETASYLSSDIQRVDMRGGWILPGFEDAHTHPAGRARTLSELDLREANLGWEEARSRIVEKARVTPENQWIVCHGWNQSTWGKIRQEDLDHISSDHGIFLINISYHGGLLNKKGEALLKEQGVAGEIVDGFVTEELFERAIIATAPDTESYIQSIPLYLQKLTTHGIIAAHDMNVATTQQMEAYAELDEKGLLPIPVIAYLNPRLLEHPSQIMRFLKVRHGNFSIAGVKIFLDGAIGTSTAAVNQPYADGTGRGILRTDFEACAGIVRQAVGLGLPQIAIHCIGDRAIDFAVTIFNRLRKEYARDISLWRFEHFEMPDENAIKTLAEHGGIASMQPNFSWDVENYRTRLGEGVKKINPFRSIMDAHAPLAFGSDDMPSGPLAGIAWAVAKAPFEHQRITLEEAIGAYTAAPATVAGMDRIRGKIAAGYEANFAVLEKNPFAVAPSEIGNISIQATWIKGKRFFTN